MSWSRIADNDLFGVRKIVINGSETLTDGATIAPTGMSVGTKQGFSIIKFTTDSGASGGDTLPHGLNSQPAMYIYKPTSTNGEWVVVHSYDYDQFAYLNDTTQFRSISSQGGGTPADPTSSVLTLYDLGVTLASKTYICYTWHDVPGLQKFGSYTGNESTDGPYVELGFRPAVLIIKNAVGDHANGANWFIFDGTRDPDNPVRLNLNPNDDSADEDDTNGTLDFLSNGFKMRSSGTHPNGSGNTIIYAAWAEVPSVDLYGGGANAR
jgi:hypothetical protein